MIVYGDPQTTADPRAVLARLVIGVGADCEALREKLIIAGQLEQGLADQLVEGSGHAHLRTCAEEITDLLAALFVAAYQAGRVLTDEDCATLDKRRARCQAALDASDIERVTLKLPEGYAFYSLYPEQYIESAKAWMAAQTGAPKCCLVVGVRSIGTSLSAVVKQVIARAGWEVRRCTVRPHGHAFSRKVDLPNAFADSGDAAIVVDEGPGLSGSSMTAVAEALVNAGIARDRISFLPAHSNEPGSASSEATRHWWKTTPRFVTQADDCRWHGQSLLERLEQQTMRHFRAKIAKIEEISGGKWRRFAYSAGEPWPVVTPAFECPKWLFRLVDGRQILWKFEGLHSSEPEPPARTAAIQPVPQILRFLGFTAYEWIIGKRLQAASADPMVVAEILRYVIAAAGPSLTEDQARDSHERLAKLLHQNTLEVLADTHTAAATILAQHAQDSLAQTSAASYGDGRLGPWEFVCAEGVIYKADWHGHTRDHTIVGVQPLIWDIAGLAIEWELAPEQVYAQAQALSPQACPTSQFVFEFYCAAYAAFRLGALSFWPDESNRVAMDAALAYYRAVLARALASTQKIAA